MTELDLENCGIEPANKNQIRSREVPLKASFDCKEAREESGEGAAGMRAVSAKEGIQRAT